METVIFNANIYLEREKFAQALLIRDGVIAQVGTNEEVLSAAGAKVRRSPAALTQPGAMAASAPLGVELFVLDDGWFGARTHESAGLGDWAANPDRLPGGITRLAERVERLGLRFGLWFEPEMVNKDSD